jgi:outer membrane lipoprotein carrier protein
MNSRYWSGIVANSERCLIIGMFAVCVFFANAQPKTAHSLTTNDPEAEKYLKAVKIKLQNLKAFKLNFTTEITDADQKKQTNKGTYLVSGEKFEMDMSDIKTINDGKTHWSIDKIEKEINITKYTKPKLTKTENPIDIIKNYSSLFKFRVKEPIQNQRIVIELVPLNKNNSFFKVDLVLDTKKNQLLGAKLYDKSGHRIQFSFTNMQELTILPAGAFVLNKDAYKEYEILDMR